MPFIAREGLLINSYGVGVEILPYDEFSFLVSTLVFMSFSRSWNGNFSDAVVLASGFFLLI